MKQPIILLATEPKQLGFSAVVVLAITIPNPDLAGMHQKIKEIVPWLQVCALTTTTVSHSLTIAKAFKKSDKQ